MSNPNFPIARPIADAPEILKNVLRVTFIRSPPDLLESHQSIRLLTLGNIAGRYIETKNERNPCSKKATELCDYFHEVLKQKKKTRKALLAPTLLQRGSYSHF